MYTFLAVVMKLVALWPSIILVPISLDPHAPKELNVPLANWNFCRVIQVGKSLKSVMLSLHPTPFQLMMLGALFQCHVNQLEVIGHVVQ